MEFKNLNDSQKTKMAHKIYTTLKTTADMVYEESGDKADYIAIMKCFQISLYDIEYALTRFGEKKFSKLFDEKLHTALKGVGELYYNMGVCAEYNESEIIDLMMED